MLKHSGLLAALGVLASAAMIYAAGEQVLLEGHTLAVDAQDQLQSSSPLLSAPAGGSLNDGAYICPSQDGDAQALVSSTIDGDTFMCTYTAGTCTYQTATGALYADSDAAHCVDNAPLSSASTDGREQNSAVVRNRRSTIRKRRGLLTSGQLQEMVIRNIL